MVVTTRTPTPTVVGLVRGLAAARLAAVGWVVAAFAVAADEYRRRTVAAVVVAVLVGAVVALAVLAWRAPQRAVSTVVVAAEVALVAAALMVDAWCWPAGELFSVRQSLVGALPLVAALSAAVALGPVAALVGAGLGAMRAVAAVVNDSTLRGGRITSVMASVVFGAVAGWIGGWVTDRVRQAEDREAQARAREDLVRSVHDTVLQTLALAQRSASPEMAAMARRTDAELRQVLFGPTVADVGLRAAIERAARSAGTRFDHVPTVNVLVEVEPSAEVAMALAGAVGEAVTNALRHGAAAQVTVFAEAAPGEVTVTVRDNGRGFDPAMVAEGTGLAQSVRARVAQVGGTVRIESAPGQGCRLDLEVRG